MASVTSVKLNPANSKVYACCLDKSIKVYGLKSGTMLKELAGGHDSYIQSFDFIKVPTDAEKRTLAKTDDLVLSWSFDGQVVLWAIGPNARLFSARTLIDQEHIPAVQAAINLSLKTLLRQENFLLNNIDVNPVEADAELLVTFRAKDSYLIKLTSGNPAISASYDSVEEVRYGRFSQCGRFVYTFTSSGTLNIFNKTTGKLLSKYDPHSKQEVKSTVAVEVDGILGTAN